MWPFSKIDKLQSEMVEIQGRLGIVSNQLNIVSDQLVSLLLDYSKMKDSRDRQYRNECRLFDIIILEAREERTRNVGCVISSVELEEENLLS